MCECMSKCSSFTSITFEPGSSTQSDLRGQEVYERQNIPMLGTFQLGKKMSPCSLQNFVLGKDFLYLTPSVPAFLETLAQLSVFLASKHEHPKLRLTLFNWTSVSEELSYLGFVYLLQSIHVLIISSG